MQSTCLLVEIHNSFASDFDAFIMPPRFDQQMYFKILKYLLLSYLAHTAL